MHVFGTPVIFSVRERKRKIKRDLAIDYFKGVLVLGMIYTHVLQFFSNTEYFPAADVIIQFFNLITFSGFIFCFGYVNQLAYYRKPFRKVYLRMLSTSFKTLIAFYISGIAFQVFISNQDVSMKSILPVLLLKVIPGWSEFLLSFSLILLVGILLFPFIQWLIEKPVVFLLLTFLLLLTTFFDYSAVTISQIGLLIGTDMFPTFPVLQYLFFYNTGIYFARYAIRFEWKVFLLAALGTSMFIAYLFVNDFQLPERFPPSFYWVIGPTLILYLYYLAMHWCHDFFGDMYWLRKIGENALFFLVISNVFIFTLSSTGGLVGMNPLEGLLLTLLLLLTIYYFLHITSHPKKYL